MNILLTGSGGFLGGNLKKYLKDRHILYTPRSFELDLTDEKAVKEYFKRSTIDFIIHCGTTGGARGIQDKETTVEDNLAMVNNILQYKNAAARVILFGSGAMYGKTRNLNKVKEDEIGSFIPIDLYGKSKMLIAQMIKDRRDVTMLNIFACYGFNEKETRFPSCAVNCVLQNTDITINQNVIFDYLWIEDALKIIEYFINNKPDDNIINITPDKSSSLIDIAKTVLSFSNNKNLSIKVKSGSSGLEYTGDNGRLKKNYPGITFTPLEDGLKKLYLFNKNVLSTH